MVVARGGSFVVGTSGPLPHLCLPDASRRLCGSQIDVRAGWRFRRVLEFCFFCPSTQAEAVLYVIKLRNGKQHRKEKWLEPLMLFEPLCDLMLRIFVQKILFNSCVCDVE